MLTTLLILTAVMTIIGALWYRADDCATMPIIFFFLAAIGGIVVVIYTLTLIRWSPSTSVVSGVVYNVENDAWPSGATNFSIRATEDTVVTSENKSSYCLPKGSKDIALINEATENKEIKVIVRTSKVKFQIVEGSTTCVGNVQVERKD